jgi:hypothetical protein
MINRIAIASFLYILDLLNSLRYAQKLSLLFFAAKACLSMLMTGRAVKTLDSRSGILWRRVYNRAFNPSAKNYRP